MEETKSLIYFSNEFQNFELCMNVWCTGVPCACYFIILL